MTPMYMREYTRWTKRKLEDDELTMELRAIAGDDEAIRDRFATDLSFGTAGLRGVLGAGTNRMNIYTVRRATQGLANWLKRRDEEDLLVAISYDSRKNSERFAKEAAGVLAANDITAALYPQLEPVPALSFAVRNLGADAGIMITASHNPAKYNGYKVYGSDGCQLSTEESAAVTAEVEKVDIFEGVSTLGFERPLRGSSCRYIPDGVLEEYFSCVKAQAVRPGVAMETHLKLVYSPLNGAGNLPVRRVLREMGFRDVSVVPEQEMPDGSFPTCPYPNPERRETMQLSLDFARQIGADLALATDPDADRVGIAVRGTDGEYRLLTGNEVGVLLLDYICTARTEAGTLPTRPVAVESIVSTPMAAAVAAHWGVEMVRVLTGFKYIGEQIRQLEEKGEESRFVFGFEESYGYLAGTHVRDKDAVVASMLICEMAAWHKKRGATLLDALDALYENYGHYLSAVDSFEFEGLADMQRMADIMAGLRKTTPKAIGGCRVLTVDDLQAGTHRELTTGKQAHVALPPADVLHYTLEGGHSVIVRPSGTEPKVKVYYTTKAASMAEAGAVQDKLAAAMAPLMK